MDQVGLEQRLIILTNSFAVLIDKMTIRCLIFFTSNRINKQETEKGIYFQIDRVRSKTNKDTSEANTLLRQNGASNDSSKKFGSGYRPSENRYEHDNDVQGSKRKKQTENRLKQDFSQDDNDIKKKN